MLRYVTLVDRGMLALAETQGEVLGVREESGKSREECVCVCV